MKSSAVLVGLGVGAGLLYLFSSQSSQTPVDTTTPDPANNPPLPTGYSYMQQSGVTPDMTAWAVQILNDTTTYPMFSTTTGSFNGQTVLARVEWHVPDFIKNYVHRGVSLLVASS